MAAVPSEIYPHIYSFLLQNKFVKTAKSFKKETLLVSAVSFLNRGLIISLTNVFQFLSIVTKRYKADDTRTNVEQCVVSC